VFVKYSRRSQEVVIEGDERRTNPFGVRQNKVLKDPEGCSEDDEVLGVEGAFEGGEEEGHAGEEFVRAGFHEVDQALHG